LFLKKKFKGAGNTAPFLYPQTKNSPSLDIVIVEKIQVDKDKTDVSMSVRPTQLRAWDDVRQAIIEEGA
jgi:hypothetical protein